MKYNIDSQYTLNCFKELVNVPSPVGYYVKMNPVIEKIAASFGKTVSYDNKSTPYITLDGEDNSKTVLISAHLDTIGLMVKRIDKDGMIRVRNTGGINFCSLEGENVTIFTRDGRSYTGLMACQSHSVHVFDDARTLTRDENTMMIILDEKVKSADDVRALGIRHGDMVSADPRCTITENGFIKSRYIDDKAAVACVFTMLKYLTDNNLKPKYRTLLAFPYYEEISIGGTYVPPEVSEYVAIDIGLIGPDYDGNEFCVAICCKDNASPYDYELTTRLINTAEKIGLNTAVDIFYRYGTDASAALKGGNNVKSAAFGMPIYCRHGMERTHIDSLNNTTSLIIAYALAQWENL